MRELSSLYDIIVGVGYVLLPLIGLNSVVTSEDVRNIVNLFKGPSSPVTTNFDFV